MLLVEFQLGDVTGLGVLFALLKIDRPLNAEVKGEF